MARMTAQDRFNLLVIENKFPKGGEFSMVLPPSLYARAKDDPAFANVEFRENKPIPKD